MKITHYLHHTTLVAKLIHKMSLIHSFTSPPFSRTLTNSLISSFHRKNAPIRRNLIHQKVSFTSIPTSSDLDDEPNGEEDAFSGRRKRTNYAGVRIDESVEDAGKSRLDAWICNRISGVSRARVQSSIRSGLVSVNHRVVVKVNLCICLILCQVLAYCCK